MVCSVGRFGQRLHIHSMSIFHIRLRIVTSENNNPVNGRLLELKYKEDVGAGSILKTCVLTLNTRSFQNPFIVVRLEKKCAQSCRSRHYSTSHSSNAPLLLILTSSPSFTRLRLSFSLL